jgi:hypothetical protein
LLRAALRRGQQVDERERKIGLNEALFREVNERIGEVNRTFAAVTGVIDVMCECGDAGCIERITVDQPEYEAVRREGAQFLIVPGHEIVDVETVVQKTPSYYVVRKNAGAAEALAEFTDPRS